MEAVTVEAVTVEAVTVEAGTVEAVDNPPSNSSLTFFGLRVLRPRLCWICRLG